MANKLKYLDRDRRNVCLSVSGGVWDAARLRAEAEHKSLSELVNGWLLDWLHPALNSPVTKTPPHTNPLFKGGKLKLSGGPGIEARPDSRSAQPIAKRPRRAGENPAHLPNLPAGETAPTEYVYEKDEP